MGEFHIITDAGVSIRCPVMSNQTVLLIFYVKIRPMHSIC